MDSVRSIEELIKNLERACATPPALDAPAGKVDDAPHPPDGSAVATPPPIPAGYCGCCEITAAVTDEGLCEDCANIYPTFSARALNAACDCGHRPEGRVAFDYKGRDGAKTLCGLKCVRKHFKEVFAYYFVGH